LDRFKTVTNDFFETIQTVTVVFELSPHLSF